MIALLLAWLVRNMGDRPIKLTVRAREIASYEASHVT